MSDTAGENGADHGGAVVMAAKTLLEVTRADFMKWVLHVPSGQRIYTLARALCERAGHDPDTVVMGHAGAEPMYGPKRTVCVYAPIQPAWMLYWQDALDAITMVRETEPGVAIAPVPAATPAPGADSET